MRHSVRRSSGANGSPDDHGLFLEMLRDGERKILGWEQGEQRIILHS